MFTVVVISICLILFLVERRLNGRTLRKRSSSRPTRRVASPRRK